MAKADTKTAAKSTTPKVQAEEVKGTENKNLPTVQQGGAVAEMPEGVDFSADAGRGMEGATQESYAIPFLMVLQKGSPQVDEASPTHLKDAKQGMFYQNVSGKVMDGREKGVVVVPCAYRRVFLRWGPRANGGGFKGELMPEEVSQLRADGKIKELEGRLYFPLPDGSVNPDKCDRVADTRNHYCLLENDDGSWTKVLMSLTSTQIKKSKVLMSALADVKLKGANGLMYTPASWANRVRVTTVPESNDKGSWMGVHFALEGTVRRADMYQDGKAFNESVRKGTVEVKYEEQEDPTTVDAERPASAGKAGGSF